MRFANSIILVLTPLENKYVEVKNTEAWPEILKHIEMFVKRAQKEGYEWRSTMRHKTPNTLA